MSRVIGKRIKKELAWQGYTYDEFCDIVGISSKAVLANILNKREDDRWRYSELKRFCDALYINLQGLLDDVYRCGQDADGDYEG